MNADLQQTIAAYRAEQARQAKIGDIFAGLFIAALTIPTLFAIAYAFTA